MENTQNKKGPQLSRADLLRIKNYCSRASLGPWVRSADKSKTIVSSPDKPTRARYDICKLTGGEHSQDWFNFQFIANARQDLPKVTQRCLELMKLMDMLTRHVELERANRRLEIAIIRNHLKKVRKKRIELLNKKTRLESQHQEDQLKLKLVSKQLELERSINRMELERSRKDLEKERAEKLELYNREQDRSRCDQLLDDLDRIETVLKSKEEQEKRENGWTTNDSRHAARNYVFPRDKKQDQQQDCETKDQSPQQAETLEDASEYTHPQQQLDQAQNPDLEAGETQTQPEEVEYSEPQPEPAAQQPAEPVQEQTEEHQPNSPFESKLGLDQAKQQVANTIENGPKSDLPQSEDDEDMLSFEEMMNELDRTEAALNSWSKEETPRYGQFGENITNAARVAREFVEPALDLTRDSSEQSSEQTA